MGHEGSLSASAWEEAIKKVLQGIDDGEWSKVVLAQRVTLNFSSVLEPMHLLLRLLEADDAAIAQDTRGASSHSSGARHAYIFLLQPSADAAFMGCTPEKLFKLHGDRSLALSDISTLHTGGHGESRNNTAKLFQISRHERTCSKSPHIMKRPVPSPPTLLQESQ